MKKILMLAGCLLATCLLAGCGAREPIVETDTTIYEETVLGGESVAGRRYTFGEGILGEFTLTLHADGSMSYYEGGASSHIGIGTWTQVGDLLTISESNGRGGMRVNHFRVTQNALLFVTEGSDNFIYVKVADGERFHLKGQA